MTSYTVFGAEVPVVTNGNDSDSYALGTVVEITGSGNIIKARQYFSNPLPSGPVTWRVSDLSTLDLLGSHVFTSPVSGWVEQDLAAIIPITAPRNVLVWCGTPDGYVYTNGKFSSVGITNGPLTSPASADDPTGNGNGRFGGDPDSPPLGTSGATAYFADLVFDVPAPQGQAAFGVDLAVAAAGARDSVGVAGIGLDLAVSATGDAPVIPPSEGEVALGLILTMAGEGVTPPVGAAQGSAAFAIDLALATAGERDSAGVAGFGLDLAISATGDAPSPDAAEGSAALGLLLTMAGVGFTPASGQAQGSAAFSVNFGVAATGERESAGVAGFNVNLALAAVGDNDGPVFPCRPVRSFSEVMPT